MVSLSRPNKSKAVHTIVWYSLPAWSAVENPACSLVRKVTVTDVTSLIERHMLQMQMKLSSETDQSQCSRVAISTAAT